MASESLLYRVRGSSGSLWAVRREGTFFEVAEDIVALAWRLDGTDPLEAAGDPVGSVSETEVLPPASPSKIVCTGRNYRQHAEELGNEVPEEPLLFLKPPSSLIGPDDAIELPEQSGEVHYEGEIAVVFGATAREVDAEEAEEAILGYTCANDVTARDIQRREGAFTRAKGFDTFCPLGPGLAASERFDSGTAELETRVDGETRQHAALRDLVFSVPELVAFVSDVMTIQPGDVLLSGTPPGVGAIEAGSTVEVAAASVGTLANSVEDRGTTEERR